MIKSLTLENISKKYNFITVLNNINHNLKLNKFYALTGLNGSGKTTLIQIICGIISPSSGKVIFNNTENFKYSYLGHSSGFYSYLNSIENLLFFGRLFNMHKSHIEKYAEETLNKYNLWQHRNIPIKNYSQGMKKKLGLIRALMPDPDLLLLDEPLSNLDISSQKIILEILTEYKKSAVKSAIIISHDLEKWHGLIDETLEIKNQKLVKVSSHA